MEHLPPIACGLESLRNLDYEVLLAVQNLTISGKDIIKAYDVWKIIQQNNGLDLAPSRSSINHSLSKLAQKGLVTSTIKQETRPNTHIPEGPSMTTDFISHTTTPNLFEESTWKLVKEFVDIEIELRKMRSEIQQEGERILAGTA